MRLPALLFALLLAAAPGCGDGSDDPGDGAGGTGGSGGGGPVSCDDPQTFRCTSSCDGGQVSDPVCANGRWGCVAGLTPTSVCAERCPGVAAPGERCGESGWVCDPSDEAIDACPNRLCSTCEGFDGPVFGGACVCSCYEDGVFCDSDIPAG